MGECLGDAEEEHRVEERVGKKVKRNCVQEE
jgi:hypothetical protein